MCTSPCSLLSVFRWRNGAWSRSSNEHVLTYRGWSQASTSCSQRAEEGRPFWQRHGEMGGTSYAILHTGINRSVSSVLSVHQLSIRTSIHPSPCRQERFWTMLREKGVDAREITQIPQVTFSPCFCQPKPALFLCAVAQDLLTHECLRTHAEGPVEFSIW